MSYIHTDGVECSDDKRTLIKCPKELSSITIPDSVTAIGTCAFSYCTSLKEIRIPKGTK